MVGRVVSAMDSLKALLLLSAKNWANSTTSIIIMQLVSMSWNIISVPIMLTTPILWHARNKSSRLKAPICFAVGLKYPKTVYKPSYCSFAQFMRGFKSHLSHMLNISVGFAKRLKSFNPLSLCMRLYQRLMALLRTEAPEITHADIEKLSVEFGEGAVDRSKLGTQYSMGQVWKALNPTIRDRLALRDVAMNPRDYFDASQVEYLKSLPLIERMAHIRRSSGVLSYPTPSVSVVYDSDYYDWLTYSSSMISQLLKELALGRQIKKGVMRQITGLGQAVFTSSSII